jgi:Putative adhesin
MVEDVLLNKYPMKSILTTGILLSVFAVSAQSTKIGDFHLDKEYKIEATGTIYLDASDAKVFITGSNRVTAHVKIDREVTSKGMTFGEREFRVDVIEQSGNLNIREESKGTSVGVIGYYNEKYSINIEAPEGVSLVINGDDGDYFIKAVNGSIELDLDDADIELTGCLGDSFKVKLDDGDLRMDTGRGTLDVDADDADVEIKNASFQKIMAQLDDGDFVIETTLDDNGDYFIEAQDGLVSLKVLGGGGRFDIRHDDARVITEGGFEITEKSEDRTRATLASGNAKVEIRADDARVRLIK